MSKNLLNSAVILSLMGVTVLVAALAYAIIMSVGNTI